MHAWTVLGVLSVLLLSTAFPMLIASAQEPTRSLGLDPLEYMTPDLVVSSTTTGYAYFETIVAIYDTVDEQGTVYLDVTNDMDWPISVSPKSFNFTKPISQKVNISVSVPAGTDASITAIVKLLGNAEFQGEIVSSSVSGYLFLKQIASVSANYSYIKRGATETWVQINIVNTGNGRDTFLMLLLDGEKLDDANIQVIMGNNAISISMNSSTTVRVHCTYEGTVYPKKFDLRIQISSFGSGVGPPLQVIVIPLSFKGPDPPIQPIVFVGVIAAFVIVVVLILAVVLRGPVKKPK